MEHRSKYNGHKRKPVLVVGHEHPDTDCLACAWLIRHHVGQDVELDMALVNAGTRLPENDPRWKTHKIYHVDTGGGMHDQHGKELKHSSSFELLAKDLGYIDDPAVQKLLPMVNNADNAIANDPTSIHYLITALPFYCKDGHKKFGPTNWLEVLYHAFFTLDVMARKWLYDAEQAKKFDQQARIEKLSNGLLICCLQKTPALRHEAFKRGADVVLFMNSAKGGFWPVIQVGEKSNVDLTTVAVALRQLEAEKRGVDVSGLTLDTFKQVPGVPGWFLHDSRRMIGCGTRSHPLSGDDMTKIGKEELCDLVRKVLASSNVKKSKAA